MASACSSIPLPRFPSPLPPPSASPFSFEDDDVQTNSGHGFLGYAPISLSSVADPRTSSAVCLFHGFAAVEENENENDNSNSNSEDCSSSFSSSFLSSHSGDEDDEDLQDTSTSPESSSSSPLSRSLEEGPLNSLESLCSSLPIKRGLSRYFTGKSQSFSSLAHVSSIEDLAKPENPYAKRRKMQVQAALHLKSQSYPPRSSSSNSIAKRQSNSRFGRSPPKSFSSKRAPWPATKCFSVPQLQESVWENAVSFSPKP